MAATLSLSQGCLHNIKEQGFSEPVTLKVKSVQQFKSQYKGVLTDGNADTDVLFATQLSHLMLDGTVKASAIIKLKDYTMNPSDGGKSFIYVTDMEVLSKGEGGDTGPGLMDATNTIKLGTPAVKGAGKPAASPMFTPSMVKQELSSMSQVGPTPPSAAPPSISKRTSGFCYISEMHPYQDDWKLRAKLVRKQPLRSVKSSGASILTVELVDDKGTQIQGTFWRGHADRWAAHLEEGKVYVFERFQVKPANKHYATVRNDYEIQFTDKTDVSEAADQEVAATMTAAVEHVPIDQLPRYITRKMPVDVLGVVLSVGASQTVKRKSDQTELARRDVTLADRSGKTVVLTLWGDNVSRAAELEGHENVVVVEVTACRVSDYNGCSLSSLGRSQLTINPETPAALDLSTWWQTEGSTMTLAPVGGEAAMKASSGGGSRQQHNVKDVTSQPVPEPDAKPVYHNLIVAIAKINSDQTMYYLANPQTGRKVVERDGRYYSEADGASCDNPSNRYVLNARVMDATGDCYLSFFNDQAEQALGISADDLAALKSENEARFKARCQAAQWQEWSVSVATKSREYQGERKMRHNVVTLKPINYAQEAQRLLGLIEKY